jgi:N-acetylneuraminic acid mutarotase
MQRKSTFSSAFVGPRALIGVLISAVICSIITVTLLAFSQSQPSLNASQKTLTFEERVAYQRAIEDVYWHHRIWPKERPDSKPPLEAVMSQAQLEKKVTDYLHNSQVLEDYWQRPITAEQLQAEMDRMAKNSKQPQVLQELFDALGNDPIVVAECLARPVLVERTLETVNPFKEPLESGITKIEMRVPVTTPAPRTHYMLPAIAIVSGGCTDDTWTATSTINAPETRYGHKAVWTGSEMIVWGGVGTSAFLNTGGRYNPSTDSWAATTTTNAPEGREFHTAVWTGTEMIVWGGDVTGPIFLNTGGRYNPSSDSWTATSTTNAPEGRAGHTAVWTGSEMIVWGGDNGDLPPALNTGGRYNPISDNWVPTSTTNAADPRSSHTAVWTGSEMIVWGGLGSLFNLNSGGRYNPSTDSWTATSLTNAPSGRFFATAVWTDSEMIVWGGADPNYLNTGGRYTPGTDSWLTTSTTNAPAARDNHTAVWTGSEMIVWGGLGTPTYFNTGGRYNPGTNGWTATNTSNAPSARSAHTAVWTDSEMIVWGGTDDTTSFNTGGRYCAQPGPTPTPTPTVTPTASPRPTPTPRSRPTPRVRPTPP